MLGGGALLRSASFVPKGRVTGHNHIDSLTCLEVEGLVPNEPSATFVGRQFHRQVVISVRCMIAAITWTATGLRSSFSRQLPELTHHVGQVLDKWWQTATTLWKIALENRLCCRHEAL